MSSRAGRRALASAAIAAAVVAGPAHGDVAYVLDDDDDAAQVRVDLVQGAEREILAAYFIFHDDATGMGALAQLREAALRGVSVRMIIDAPSVRVRPEILAALLDAGVELRLYHKISLGRPLWWVRRMHDKLLIVDGRDLVTGGRNVEEPYFGLSAGRNYVDRDVYVHGDAAAEARAYFLELWKSRHVDPPVRRSVPEPYRLAAGVELDVARLKLRGHGLATVDSRIDWPARGLEVGAVAFFHDPVAAPRKKGGIRDDLIAVIRQACESIVVETPYLVPTRVMFDEIRAAVERGVRVRILTNSLGATDSVWAHSGYVGKRRRLVAEGVDLWEYAGPRSLHAKTVVVDGRLTLIGSYNLDPRSHALNTEVAAVVDDPRIAALTLESMDAHLASAWRVGADGLPEGHRERYPGASCGRRIKVFLYRLLLPLTRRQL